jgi:hypothetical protein
MRGYDAGAAARRAAEGAKKGLINEWAETKRDFRIALRIAVSVPLGLCLWKLGNAPVVSERPLWLVLSIAALVPMAVALPRLGLAGGRGALWGLWLWLLSIGFVGGMILLLGVVGSSIELLFFAKRSNPTIGWTEVGMMLAWGLILGMGCDALLKRGENNPIARPRGPGRDTMFGG